MLVFIGLIAVAIVVVLVMRRPRTVRRMSNENRDEILGRKPVSPPCPCGKPRCPHKGKMHPREVKGKNYFRNKK